MRGVLTDELQVLARRRLNRKLTGTDELRLMAYVQYLMVNEQRIDPRKCNRADRDVLRLWREEGRIAGGAGGLYMTRKFWDIINEFLWHSYVASQGGELRK